MLDPKKKVDFKSFGVIVGQFEIFDIVIEVDAIIVVFIGKVVVAD